MGGGVMKKKVMGYDKGGKMPLPKRSLVMRIQITQ